MSNKILRITSVTSLFGEYTVQRKKMKRKRLMLNVFIYNNASLNQIKRKSMQTIFIYGIFIVEGLQKEGFKFNMLL